MCEKWSQKKKRYPLCLQLIFDELNPHWVEYFNTYEHLRKFIFVENVDLYFEFPNREPPLWFWHTKWTFQNVCWFLTNESRALTILNRFFRFFSLLVVENSINGIENSRVKFWQTIDITITILIIISEMGTKNYEGWWTYERSNLFSRNSGAQSYQSKILWRNK